MLLMSKNKEKGLKGEISRLAIEVLWNAIHESGLWTPTTQLPGFVVPTSGQIHAFKGIVERAKRQWLMAVVLDGILFIVTLFIFAALYQEKLHLDDQLLVSFTLSFSVLGSAILLATGDWIKGSIAVNMVALLGAYLVYDADVSVILSLFLLVYLEAAGGFLMATFFLLLNIYVNSLKKAASPVAEEEQALLQKLGQDRCYQALLKQVETMNRPVYVLDIMLLGKTYERLLTACGYNRSRDT